MKNKSRLAAKLMRRYLLMTGSLIFLFIVIPLILKVLLSSRTWYYSDHLYPFLNLINRLLVPLLIVIAVTIWVAGTYLFIRRAAKYLDETLAAAKQLVEEPEKEIELSEDLADFALEMNRVRINSLFHQRAAQDAEQKKNDLIVYLAHDLRTPLTSIIGYLTLLEESPQLPPEVREKYTGITLDKAYRLENLINEFFEITRFNLATVGLTTRPTELSVMLQQLSYEFLPLMTEKDLSWEQELKPEIWVDIDTEKFERVLDNIIKNAINYADPATALNLHLIKRDNQAILTLKNQGATISEDKLARIFEPFYRGDSARGSRSGGTGLGLPIAKELVESHGGTLAAKSSAGTFTMILSLPIAASHRNTYTMNHG